MSRNKKEQVPEPEATLEEVATGETGEEANEAEQVDTDAEIKVAFETSLGAEQGEDEIKMAMIGAGATFKNVTRMYNAYMIDAGLAISASDRKEAVDSTLEGRDLSTEEGFDAAVIAVIGAVMGANERSASALIRAFGKKTEADVFAKPKVEGGTRNPFVQVFHAALIANPAMDEQGLKDVIAGLDEQHQVNPNRWFSQHNNIRKTANAIAAKFTATAEAA